MHWMNRAAALAAFGMLGIAVMAIAAPAFAAAPEPWQLGMQAPASPVKERIEGLHDMLLVIITLITLFVLVLLVYTIWRFRASRNPVPTRTAHNTLLEVAWTVIPVLILVIIAIPSFKLLYFQDRAPNAEMTIKVVGHQWYWSYEYPDHGDLKFDSYIVQEDDLKPGQKRLLEVDNRLVLPVGTTVRVLVAGTDVIHSWFVPSLGLQIYAMPGRLNETWVRVDEPGVYYGQCNQICGVNHAFMPIAIEAVSKEQFGRWIEEAKQKFAATPADRPVAVAANAAR
ncbi:MAG TPA: cytochrome c oxidase subunit II [Alphaproteobacteria bacterium]